MNEKQLIKLILSIFDSSDHGEMFAVVDDTNGIRKSGIAFIKLEEVPNGDVIYKVAVNEDILRKWLGDEE